jgi:hypothetical protein
MSDLQDSPHKERIPLWPIWVAVGFPLLLIVLETTPIATNFAFVMIWLPGFLITWAILGFWAVILTVRWMCRRAWRRAMISVVLPLIVLIAGLQTLSFIRFCSNAGDTLHFYVRYFSYVRTARAEPPNGEPRLLTINLGGMSWASRGFVYDESDELLRDPSMQSSGWKARAQNSELGCGYGALPMPGPIALTQHWYLASFAC